MTTTEPGADLAKRTAAADVVRRLREHGHEAWFAGGCVRDGLLGRPPEDYDVATSAAPETVRGLFKRTVPVGMRFGVILVLDGPYRFEVATFRSDAAYVDGRRPSAVHFGSAAQDAQRRDFTINALLADPFSGAIVDHVGGRDDLRAGVIRAIGDPYARIAEDRLRMLRAVRFAARLGFAIDADTRAAIRASAASVVDMAAERIGDEITKMLTEGNARRAFELLDDTGLLGVVLPEVAAMQGVEQSPDFHPEGDVWRHTLLLLQQLPAGAAETLAFGALLHDVAKPLCAGMHRGRRTFYGHCERGADVAVAILQRLRRSRETWERVAWLVKNHLRPVQAPAMRLATLKKMLAEEGFPELMRLCRLDALSASLDLQYVLFCEDRRAAFAAQQLRPPRLLGGEDLLRLGYARGPTIGRILHALEDAQLEGEVATGAEAEAWVRAKFPPPA